MEMERQIVEPVEELLSKVPECCVMKPILGLGLLG